jgi:hypothetical protein
VSTGETEERGGLQGTLLHAYGVWGRGVDLERGWKAIGGRREGEIDERGGAESCPRFLVQALLFSSNRIGRNDTVAGQGFDQRERG